MKVYTKTGDKGETSLIGGKRVSKADMRLEAYGTVDELNSCLGCLAAEDGVQSWVPMLQQIQARLFDMGSQLACEDAAARAKLPHLDDSMIVELEKQMDVWTTGLKPLKHFVLPGGTRAAGTAHLARTICRRAERCVVNLNNQGVPVDTVLVRYLNRLSDWLFVFSRELNRQAGVEEPLWIPRI